MITTIIHFDDHSIIIHTGLEIEHPAGSMSCQRQSHQDKNGGCDPSACPSFSGLLLEITKVFTSHSHDWMIYIGSY